MTLARKKKQRVRKTSVQPDRRPSNTTADTPRLLARIDELIRDLETLRRELMIPPQPAATNLATQLFGALGHGTWDEYDLNLDWMRFGEWQAL